MWLAVNNYLSMTLAAPPAVQLAYPPIQPGHWDQGNPCNGCDSLPKMLCPLLVINASIGADPSPQIILTQCACTCMYYTSKKDIFIPTQLAYLLITCTYT